MTKLHARMAWRAAQRLLRRWTAPQRLHRYQAECSSVNMGDFSVFSGEGHDPDAFAADRPTRPRWETHVFTSWSSQRGYGRPARGHRRGPGKYDNSVRPRIFSERIDITVRRNHLQSRLVSLPERPLPTPIGRAAKHRICDRPRNCLDAMYYRAVFHSRAPAGRPDRPSCR